MSLKLRLTRGGAKKHPFYHIVAIDSRAARDSAYLARLGTYNPLKDPAEVTLDLPEVDRLLKNGAQPTATVKRLIRRFRLQNKA